MGLDESIINHYTQQNLCEKILQALKKSGKDIQNLTLEDLAPVEEFHFRGREATKEIAEKLKLSSKIKVLDIGCGIGGPSRFFAKNYGCKVVGIDITPEYCEVATMLSKRTGLGNKTEFHASNAISTPFDNEEFDVATIQHVGMNIENKDKLYKEACRILKPGGKLSVYDVTANGGEVMYPTPWADDKNQSFLLTPIEMKEKLTTQGFEITEFEDKTKEAKQWFHAVMRQLQESGPQPLGLHLLLGPNTGKMFENLKTNLEKESISITLLIAQKTNHIS